MGNPAWSRFTGAPPTTGHPLVAQFRALARQREISLLEISEAAGVSTVAISHWSTMTNPQLPLFDAALGAIGCELAIVDSKTGQVIRPPVTITNANAGGSR